MPGPDGRLSAERPERGRRAAAVYPAARALPNGRPRGSCAHAREGRCLPRGPPSRARNLCWWLPAAARTAIGAGAPRSNTRGPVSFRSRWLLLVPPGGTRSGAEPGRPGRRCCRQAGTGSWVSPAALSAGSPGAGGGMDASPVCRSG